MEVCRREAGLPWQGEACGACGSRSRLKHTRPHEANHDSTSSKAQAHT